MMYYFLVKCPGCGNEMKFHTDTKMLSDKRKRCVYCGRNFKVLDHLVKETVR